MVNNWASGLWVSMQVPLFVLVQSFHSLKKPVVTLNCSKLFWRIFAPFIMVQVAIFSLLGITGGFSNSLIVKFMHGGGYGPGSYFPWVYLQLAVILRFIRPMLDKGSNIKQAIIAFAICEGFEIFCSLVNMPDWLHRLLAIRYFFLIFLAWKWVKDGLQMTKTNWILSILSAVSIIYFEYYAADLEPLFYKTAWSYHRWPCYFYVAFLMTFLLNRVYLTVRNIHIVDCSVKLLSKCSYEIFLVQMAACMFIPSIIEFQNKYLNFGLEVFIIFVVSIFGGYIFNVSYNRVISRIKV